MEKKPLRALSFLLTFIMVVAAAAGISAKVQEDAVYAALRANSQYSLAGAQYTLYTDRACTTPAKDAEDRNAVLTTDANGNSSALEIEPGNYFAKETKASPGYMLDTTVHPITITEDNTEDSPATFTSSEPPAYGEPNFKVYKTDSSGETGWRKLLGTEFTIKYYDVATKGEINESKLMKTWKFTAREVEGDRPSVKYAGFDWLTDTPVQGSDEFYVLNGKRILPLGWFTIQETDAPAGMAINDTIYYGQVTQPSNGAAGQTNIEGANTSGNLEVPVDIIDDKQAISIKINKQPAQEGANLSSKASLAGAEYEVYFDDPELGEPELVGKITTDENGQGELKRRELGRENLVGNNLVAGDYFIKEVKASPGFLIDRYVLGSDGVSTEERTGEAEVSVSYDANGNEKTNSVKGTFEDGQHVFKARVLETNTSVFTYTVKSAEYATETRIKKTDATTTKELPGATLQIFDSEGNIVEEWVSTEEEHYVYGLPSGEYTLREITAPYGYDIAEDIKFTVEDGKIVTNVEMHNKPVEVGTVATDAENGTHQGSFKEEETINDLVILKGLTVGAEYQVKGKLVDQATGEVLKDKDGNDVEGECEPFTATSENMEVTITFTVDSSKFGKDFSAVAFEKLYRTSAIPTPEGTPDRPEEELPKEVGGHEDPDDEPQVIHYGGIVRTIATDENGISQNVFAGENTVIIDTVEYTNLSTEEEYTLEGTLYDKTTDELLDVKTTATFTPKTADGKTKMTFKFDATGLEGHDIVVFEKLLINGKPVDTHEDPNDPSQTIHVPEIATKVGTPKGNKVVDTVAYKNLIPGKKYEMVGWLINKSTGKKVKGSDGKTVFTPEEPNGRVEVTLKLKGASGSLVAFEECYAVDGKVRTKVAEHKDPDDPDQTIVRKPRPKTGDDYMIYLFGGAFLSAAALAVVLKKKGVLKK